MRTIHRLDVAFLELAESLIQCAAFEIRECYMAEDHLNGKVSDFLNSILF